MLKIEVPPELGDLKSFYSDHHEESNNLAQPENTHIFHWLRMGAGIQKREDLFSLGISIKYWKCTGSVSFRLHIFCWKIYVWKQFRSHGNLYNINALIEGDA